MPETSQDAFEALFPAKQPITAQELRERSNSLTKSQKKLNQKNSLEIRVDNPLVAAESNFWPPIPADPASLTVAAAVAKAGGREPRISVGELDSCYTVPEPVGYKRESSHRYAFVPHFISHISVAFSPNKEIEFMHFWQTEPFNFIIFIIRPSLNRFRLIFLSAAVSMPFHCHL